MRLPSPPNGAERYIYVHQGRKSYYAFAVISFLLLITGMGMFALLKVEFHFYAIYLAAFAAYISGSYYIGIVAKEFSLTDHILTRGRFFPVGEFEPSVDVYIPVCGEPLEVIRNTIYFSRKIRYKNKKIFVLDDSGSAEIRKMVQCEFPDVELIRRDKPGEGKKAGNLLNAYNQTDGDLILILDADFCPNEDILTQMVPYMLKDKAIGIVQSPQYFDVIPTTNWLERGAAAIQILFYKLVQVSRQHFDAAICVGSCALYRRKALEPTGFYQIGYSEDVHTGFMVTARGYKVHYIPIPLAKGLCPDNLRGFFTQQIRWCTGSLALCTSKLFWNANISLMQRFCFLSGFSYYLVTGLSVIFIPLCPLLMVFFAPEYVFWWNMLYYLPSTLFAFVFLPSWMRISPKWTLDMVQTRQVSYYAHLFALVDKIFGNPMQWIPTGAVIKTDLRFRVFGIVFFAISATWYLGVLIGLYINSKTIGFIHSIPHLFFSTLYAYCNLKVLLKYRQDNQ